MNNEEEALIRTIVDKPGDDTARLVYADWLDERDDPRGAYLRAELEWARTGQKERSLRTKGKKLDALWVYRVSRPPVGVCFRYPVFEFTGFELTHEDVQLGKAEIPYLPTEYAAFLLNYNGGMLLDHVQHPGARGPTRRTWYLEGLAQLALDEPEEHDEVPITDRKTLPSIQRLADNLYHPNVDSQAWGGAADQLFTNYTVIGFSQAEFGHFDCLLLGEILWRGTPAQRVFAYRNPNGDPSFFEDLSEAQCDRKAQRYKPERNLIQIAKSFTEFLSTLDKAK